MYWVLVIFIHASVMSHNDDVSITTARFYTQQACMAAGNAAKELSSVTVQSAKFACIHDSDKPS